MTEDHEVSTVIEYGVIKTMRSPTRRRRDGRILAVAFVVWFVVVLGQLLGLLDAAIRNSGL